MSPRQLFRVGIAVLGVWLMFKGMLYMLDVAMIYAHVMRPPGEQRGTSMYSCGVIGSFHLIAGFSMMCGLPAIDRIAFPRHHREMVEDGTPEVARKNQNSN